MASSDQLSIPEAARKDPKSLELVRVWVASQGQHVSLRVGVWDDPLAWGIMLADLARHIANAYQADKGLDQSKVLQRITAAFNVEMEGPTNEPSGQIRS